MSRTSWKRNTLLYVNQTLLRGRWGSSEDILLKHGTKGKCEMSRLSRPKWFRVRIFIIMCFNQKNYCNHLNLTFWIKKQTLLLCHRSPPGSVEDNKLVGLSVLFLVWNPKSQLAKVNMLFTQSRRTDACVKKRLIDMYKSKKCPSTGPFCAKLTEPKVILM